MNQEFLERSLTYRRVISLSHPIYPGIPRWGGDPPVEVETVATLEQDGYYLRQFSMGEHSGTHLNAPNSFFPKGLGVEAYGAEALVRPVIVIDWQEQAADNPDACLSDRDVIAWEAQHRRIPSGTVVLLRTGWQSRWSNPVAFLNQDEQGNCHFPGFAESATRWLLKERAIAGVGIDTHGVDGGLDTSFSTNRLILAQQGIVLECLTNLDQLPEVGATLVIGLLPLQGGSGAPANVLAFIP